VVVADFIPKRVVAVEIPEEDDFLTFVGKEVRMASFEELLDSED
jgi:hypothetical protein